MKPIYAPGCAGNCETREPLEAMDLGDEVIEELTDVARTAVGLSFETCAGPMAIRGMNRPGCGLRKEVQNGVRTLACAAACGIITIANCNPPTDAVS